MHLVRNAVDHGIELPEVRAAKGKPEEGHIMLNAYHQSGNVIIEITDDGKGLDREAITRKAIEKILLRPRRPLIYRRTGIRFNFSTGLFYGANGE